jgi:HK97 family phage portal protein
MGLFSSILGVEGNPAGGPLDDFWYNQVGAESLSGIRVTPALALQVSTVFACVKVTAETMGTLPCPVYERVSDREKRRAVETPEYKLLNVAPNAWQSPYDFKENLTAWASLHGGGFAIKIPDPTGLTTGELDPVHPSLVRVEKLPSRRLRYWIRQPSGTEKPYVQGEILHIRGFAPDGLTGANLSHSARDAIALARALEAFASRYFANDTTVGLVIEHPGKLGPDGIKNVRESFVGPHGGVMNAWRPKVLEEGMKLHRLESKAKDAQLTEGRLHQVIEICRFFRMPPHKVAHLINATFINIEHQAIEFVQDTITPWAVRWEEAITRDIILDDERYFAEFLLTALLRGDNAARSTYYRERFNIGTLSRNEIRALENENPIEGGDTYYIQGAMVPIDKSGTPVLPAKPAGESTDPRNVPAQPVRPRGNPRAVFAVLLDDAADRIARAEQRELEKRAEKATADAKRFAKWADEFYASHCAYVVRTLTPLAAAWERLSDAKVDVHAIASFVAYDGQSTVVSPAFQRDPQSIINERAERVTGIIHNAFFTEPSEDYADAA